MDDLLAYLISLIAIVCFFGIVKVISDNQVRRRLVESHADAETVRTMLLQAERNQKDGALKWGIVSMVIGLSLVAIDFLNLKPEEPSTSGLVIIAAGVGLLIYYVVVKFHFLEPDA